MPRVTKFEYPPLVTRPFIPRTQSKILEGTLGDKYEDKISKKSNNNILEIANAAFFLFRFETQTRPERKKTR